MIDIGYIPFPDAWHNRWKGFATYDHEAGRYRILIDNRQPDETQQRCLRHEFGHIMLGHILSPEPDKGSWEYAADAYADTMTDAEFSALLAISNQVHLDSFPEVVPV